MADDEEPGLGLDTVLKALRHDLLEAQQDGGPTTGLAVQSVEIELSVEISRRVSANGEVGAKWFVLSGSASGEGSRERTSTNRITLTLGPLSSGTDSTPATTERAIAGGADVSAGVISGAGPT